MLYCCIVSVTWYFGFNVAFSQREFRDGWIYPTLKNFDKGLVSVTFFLNCIIYRLRVHGKIARFECMLGLVRKKVTSLNHYPSKIKIHHHLTFYPLFFCLLLSPAVLPPLSPLIPDFYYLSSLSVIYCA